jgi:nucleobase:cation symporter-1, NCS1 family
VSETQPATLESRSIDFIPYGERYGKPRSLFTLWFSSNMTILGVSIGTLGIVSGLSLGWTIAALALGNAIGTLFMAAHSAQGPRLGIPQMIQSRAQFGVLGAGIPLVAVVVTYLLYCAANDILIAGSIADILPVSGTVAMVIFSLATLTVAFAGYRVIHWLGAAMTFVSPTLFAFAFVLLLVHPGALATPAGPAHAASGSVFALVATQAAAWGLSYGPYVADYSRYLPVEVSPATTFWYTSAGCFAGSTLIMMFGAFLATSLGGAPEDFGGTVAALFGPFRPLARLLIIVGVIEGNVMNLYSAYIAVVTIFSGVRRRPHIGTGTKLATLFILAGLAFLIGQSAQGHLQQFLGDVLNVLIYLITPWSAINLADYYLVRKGRYRTEDMYRVDGLYGAFQWKTILVYFLGVAAQAPFAQTSLFTGPIAAELGVDVAWIAGLVVPAVLYIAIAGPLAAGDAEANVLLETRE